METTLCFLNQKTQKIPITDTCHWLELITVILDFLKTFTFREPTTHFRTITFSQSPRSQFSTPILYGLCVSFNVQHFFMWKQFMCSIDCLTFSNFILHRSSQVSIGCMPVKLKWGRTKYARICNIWRRFNSYIMEDKYFNSCMSLVPK